MPIAHVSSFRPLALVALTAMLAACGAQGPVTTPANAALVDVTLQTQALSGLKAQGIPFQDDGTSAVHFVYIGACIVSTNICVKFNDQGNEDPNGTHNFVEIHPGASSTTVRLHPGSYTFFATGLSANADTGVTLAIAQENGIKVSAPAPTTVNLHLRTVVGKVSLESALPITYVMPGQTLDLNLIVQTPEADGKRYVVPLDDFEIFGLQATGTVLTKSKLGARIQAATTTDGISNFTATANVNGYARASAGISLLSGFTAEFTRPFYASAKLGADLERPTLARTYMDNIGGDANGRFTKYGFTAADNVGIAKIQVYAGVVLISSTVSGESANDIYVGADGGFSTPNLRPYYGQKITVIAQDASGNETRYSEIFN